MGREKLNIYKRRGVMKVIRAISKGKDRVKTITNYTGRHRTTDIDYLNQLLKENLINKTIKENRISYSFNWNEIYDKTIEFISDLLNLQELNNKILNNNKFRTIFKKMCNNSETLQEVIMKESLILITNITVTKSEKVSQPIYSNLDNFLKLLSSKEFMILKSLIKLEHASNASKIRRKAKDMYGSEVNLPSWETTHKILNKFIEWGVVMKRDVKEGKAKVLYTTSSEFMSLYRKERGDVE